MLHSFTQYILHCLHFTHNTVSQRAVCRPYWCECGCGENIVFVYFGKPFMKVRVHGSANHSLGSYMSLLVMVHVIHLTIHTYKNCSKWTPPASMHFLSLRSMLCRTLWGVSDFIKTMLDRLPENIDIRYRCWIHQNGFDKIQNTPGFFQRVRQSMERRLRGCIEAGGVHFEQFL